MRLLSHSFQLSHPSHPSYPVMSVLLLKTKIPCENCSKSIRQTLNCLPGVIKVECSVKDGEISIEIDGSLDDSIMRGILIEEMKKTGRICS